MLGENREKKNSDTLSESSHAPLINRKNVLLFLKILIVVLLIISVIYILNFFTDSGRSRLYLSSEEIFKKTDAKEKAVLNFSPGELIFFLVNSEKGTFEGTILEIQVSVKDEESYKYYKKAVYELNPGSNSFSAVIPRSYVDKSGYYRISVFVKGEEIAREDIVIN